MTMLIVVNSAGLFAKPNGAPVHFFGLLAHSGDLDASNPKDHVYGMLGLYQRFGNRGPLSPLLIPDYNKSLREILRDATVYAVRESDSLEYLMYVNHWSKDDITNTHWPSWVPHWHRKWEGQFDADLLPFFYPTYTTTSELHILVNQQDPSVVTLSGFEIDSLTAVWDDPYTLTFEELSTLVDSINSSILRQAGCIATVAVDTIGMTLLAGRNQDEQAATEDDALGYSALLSYIGQHDEFPPETLEELPRQDTNALSAWRFYRASEGITQNRQLFVTSCGRVGIGPRWVDTQDIVVIFPTMWHPCVLRPNGSHYHIVGSCYVYGMMDGKIPQGAE